MFILGNRMTNILDRLSHLVLRASPGKIMQDWIDALLSEALIARTRSSSLLLLVFNRKRLRTPAVLWSRITISACECVPSIYAELHPDLTLIPVERRLMIKTKL